MNNNTPSTLARELKMTIEKSKKGRRPSTDMKWMVLTAMVLGKVCASLGAEPVPAEEPVAAAAAAPENTPTPTPTPTPTQPGNPAEPVAAAAMALGNTPTPPGDPSLFPTETDPEAGLPADSAAVNKELDAVRERVQALRQELTDKSPELGKLFAQYDGPSKELSANKAAALSATPDYDWRKKRYHALALHRDELQAAAARGATTTTAAPAANPAAPAAPADPATGAAAATAPAPGTGDPEVVQTDDLAQIAAEMQSTCESMDKTSNELVQSSPDLKTAQEACNAAYMAYEDALMKALNEDHEGAWLVKRQVVLEKSLAELRTAGR